MVVRRLRYKRICLFVSASISFVLLISITAFRHKAPLEEELPPTDAEPFPLPAFSAIHLPGYIRGTARACPKTQPTLLAIVHSAPAHVLHRKAIRQTWGSAEGNATVRTVFVVGLSEVPQIERRVRQEAVEHGDIVLLDMLDSYGHLTLKHLAGLHWGLQNCPGAAYVLKADDDVLVDVKHALKILTFVFASADKSNDLIACRVVPEGSPPKRTGKWRVTDEEYPPQQYPEYCSGLAYFSRPSTLARVVAAAMSGKVPYVWIDDVFVTGLAAGQAAIKRLDLGVWYGREDWDVMKRLHEGRSVPWIVVEMKPRYWPIGAVAIWSMLNRSNS